MPSLTGTCFAVFNGYPWETCSFLLLLLFYEGKWKQSGYGKARRWGRDWEARREGKCDWDAMYARIKKKKERKENIKTINIFNHTKYSLTYK